MEDGSVFLCDGMNHWCWLGHSSWRKCCTRRRNMSCMLKSRYWSFRSSMTEHFAKGKRNEPRHGTLWHRIWWSTGTYHPFRDSRDSCFGPSVERRRRRWLVLCNRQQFYQFSQFLHLGLHISHLFTECLVLLLKMFHSLLYVCPSVVCASWFRMRTSSHFWDGLTFWKETTTCETRIWNLWMQNDACCLCKKWTIFFLKDLSK